MVAVGHWLDHNKWRMESFRRLGVAVRYIPTNQASPLSWAMESKLGYAPSHIRIRRRMLLAVRETRPDIVWVDKGLCFGPAEVSEWRQYARAVVHANNDDWLNPAYHWQSFRSAVAEYDAHIVTRPVNVAELALQGAQHVVKTWFAYEKSVHKPVGVPQTDPQIVFAGRADPERLDLFGALARRGVRIRVYGGGYDTLAFNPFVSIDSSYPTGPDYAKVLESARACLGLLARQSRDQHTCRTMEIPASRGLLVAERTPEHESLYEDGREALFFSNEDELVDKLNVAADATENARIRMNGYERATHSGYDHLTRSRELLGILEEIVG